MLPNRSSSSLLLCVAGLFLAAGAPAGAWAAGTGGASAAEVSSPVDTRPGQVGGLSADAPRPSTPTTSGSLGSSASTAPIVAADVPYGPLIATVARDHGISASLFTALVWQESGFNARARSKVGARGLTQLMPATARELGIRRIYDPAENLGGGAHFLRAQLLRFRSVSLALAAYNAGPGAVTKYSGIPPFAETRRYVRNILALEARLRAAGVR